MSRQESFGAGTLAPGLWGRPSLEAYGRGLRRSLNAFVDPDGAWVSRPATELRSVRAGSDHAKAARLIPFVHSELPNQSYALALEAGRLVPLFEGIEAPGKHIVGIGDGALAVSEDDGATWSTAGQQDVDYTVEQLVSDGAGAWALLNSNRELWFSNDGKSWTKERAYDGTIFINKLEFVPYTSQSNPALTGFFMAFGRYNSGATNYGVILYRASSTAIPATWGKFNYTGAPAELESGCNLFGWCPVSTATVSSPITGGFRVGGAITGGRAFVWDAALNNWYVQPANGWLNFRDPVMLASGRMVVVGSWVSAGTHAIGYSDNPKSTTAFTRVTDFAASVLCVGTGEVLVAGGVTGGVWVSFDGATTWTQKSALGTSILRDAKWSDDLGAFILVGTDGYVAYYTPTTDESEPFADPGISPSTIRAVATGTGSNTPLNVPVPFTEEDLPFVKYAQQGDKLLLWAPGYSAIEVSRIDHLSWQAEEVEYGAGRVIPASLEWATAPDQTTDASNPYLEEWRYIATFVAAGIESQPSRPLWCKSNADAAKHHKGIVSKTKTAKLQVSAPGDVEFVVFYKGKNGVYGRIGTVAARGGGGGLVTFLDDGIDPNYVEEPPVSRCGYSASGVQSFSQPFTLKDWTPLTAYQVGDRVLADGRVYVCRIAGISGLVGPAGVSYGQVDGASTELVCNGTNTYAAGILLRYRGATFITTQTGTQTIGAAGTEPYELGKETTSGSVKLKCVGVGEAVKWDYLGAAPQPGAEPGCGCFFGDRLVVAGSEANPESIFLSALGDYARFDAGRVVSDDDAMERQLSGRKREQIRWVLGLERLIVGTNSGVWSVGAPGDSALTPATIQARVQSEVGSDWLQALVVDEQVIYSRVKGAGVRELAYDDTRKSYLGGNLSLFSSHLFRGHKIVDWSWCEDPWRIVWAVRDDGKLLSLTYAKELKVVAWMEHELVGGAVESVCSIPEGQEDVLYLLVRRTVGGATKRYVERFATRQIDAILEGVCLDSSIAIDCADGAGGAYNVDVTEVAGGGFSAGATVDLIASGAVGFAATDVGDELLVSPTDPSKGRIKITSYTSTSQLRGTVLVDVDAAFRLNLTAWGWARDSFTGLSHLEGIEVWGVLDGTAYGPETVTGGSVTFDGCGQHALIGVAFTAQGEALDLGRTGDARARAKRTVAVELELEAYRGLWVSESLDAAADDWSEWNGEQVDSTLPVTDLSLGRARVLVTGRWGHGGRVAWEQRLPYPARVIAITREADLGG